MTELSSKLIQETTDFHGHWCPGLAIGIRASEWALAEMGRAGDEEIVAVVETDMCGVDAVQYLIGCTFGKGNLVHQDYGKNAFTFYRRSDDKAARLVAKPDIYGPDREKMAGFNAKMSRPGGLTPEEEAELQEVRAAVSRYILEAPLTDLFEIKGPNGPVPKKARLMTSLVCESCGEPVMESRTRRFRNQTLCIPCFTEAERRI